MQQKDASRAFTVMVIPHGDEQTFTIKLPLLLVNFAGIIIITMLIVSVSMVYSYRQTRTQLAQYYEVLAENRYQQEHILFLAKQTINLQDQLSSIQDLDQTIRQMMKIDTPAQQASLQLDDALLQAELRAQSPSRSTSLAATILRTQANIEQMSQAIPETEGSLKNLELQVQQQRARDAATPSIWPTTGNITSHYGYRRSPFGGAREIHSGIDIGAPRGTSVYATANGVVRLASWNGGYGNVIIIDHGYGFSTLYAHLHRMNVRVGQQVTKGQVIGLVGSTGQSTAPHLHYEVRVGGVAVDPIKYLGGR